MNSSPAASSNQDSDNLAGECFVFIAEQEAEERHRLSPRADASFWRSTIVLARGVEGTSWGMRFIEVLHGAGGWRYYLNPGVVSITREKAIQLVQRAIAPPVARQEEAP